MSHAVDNHYVLSNFGGLFTFFLLLGVLYGGEQVYTTIASVEHELELNNFHTRSTCGNSNKTHVHVLFCAKAK